MVVRTPDRSIDKNTGLLTPESTPLAQQRPRPNDENDRPREKTPSPEATQPLGSDDQPRPRLRSPAPPPPDEWTYHFNDDEMAEIHEEAPIPQDHAMAEYTAHSEQMRQELGVDTIEDTGGGTTREDGQPRRPRRSRYGDSSQPGFYARMNEGNLPSQAFFSGHLHDDKLLENVVFATSPARIEHDIHLMENPKCLKNWREARKMDNYDN